MFPLFSAAQPVKVKPLEVFLVTLINNYRPKGQKTAKNSSYFYCFNKYYPADGRGNNALLILRAVAGFTVLFLIGFHFLYSASYRKRLPVLEIFEKTIHFHVKHTFGRLVFPDIRTVVLSIENKNDLRLMSDTIKVFQRNPQGSQYDTQIKKKHIKEEDFKRLQEFQIASLSSCQASQVE